MGCERYREALSAGLDGEAAPDDAQGIDQHLYVCPSCRSWLDAAAAVTRIARTSAVPAGGMPVPVFEPPAVRCFGVPWLLRVGLAGVGFAQFLLGAAQTAGIGRAAHLDHVGAPGSGHLWHESAAWNLALGAGFLFVAIRRTRPAGLLPTLTTFVAVLGLLSLGDIADGRVGAGRLASHAFLLAGYLLTIALSRPALDPGRPPSGRRHGWSVLSPRAEAFSAAMVAEGRSAVTAEVREEPAA
ncbi:Predicted anti-sigma-YlaC factor YlaD, contains Zn-finger domain [Asanoa ishikariensis]|uniref:Predicted anti-sigma-YlaC factor YlaD, contains Zn-finger domain n=1 Tax=Asanoa ishikariensis TaxID=137265 RepID=A0A1H3UR44_9ACTN|nr:Predicted anti-sigma-YlaC factor YlaD, contains Zn-finger domain [Asanoa ishikariensis]